MITRAEQYKKQKMKKHLTYILGISVAALSACSDDAIEGSKFLNGTEKTPIAVSALLDKSNGAQTRATDMVFEENDVLIAYLRHVTWNGTIAGARTPVTADRAPLYVEFTKEGTGMDAYSGGEITAVGIGGASLGLTNTNTQQTSNLTPNTPLYWDDFSVGAKGDDTDLRTPGHYLESFYGYCYNGGNPTSTLVNATGVLGWTVDDDQFTNGIKTSDLLWSCEQNPISYDPGATADAEHGTLILPYTHAMSKVTIEIEIGDGFDVYAAGETNAGKAKAFVGKETTPTLIANRVTATTAPTYTHSTTVASGNDAKIQMRLADDEATTNKVRVYEAIIAPTVMKDGQTLAEVTVDGNTYKINLTDAILTTDPSGGTSPWSKELKAYTEADGKVAKNASGDYSSTLGGITLPGVNYRIKVTLDKQKITVVAYIKEWTDVTASTTGTISFNADVVTSVVDPKLCELTSGSFDLWRATANTTETDYDYDADEDGINKASTYEYSAGKWEAKSGNDVLYWENATTPYYFRALAKAVSYGSNGIVNSITSQDVTTAVAQGTKAETIDLLWAQTSEHEAKDANGNYFLDEQDPSKHKLYEAGAAIDPRTSDVPLTFEHAMSKISVELQTSDVATERVDLTNATISIINLYNGGTIGVRDGLVTKLTAPNPADGEDPMTVKGIAHTEMKDFLVVPQSLVYLKDGTTERTITPIFYSADELTAIYPNASGYAGSQNTSIGSGTPSYYLTRELTAVPAVYYADNDEDKAIIYEFNMTLDGHKVKDDIEIPEVLQVNYDYDGFITDQHHKTFTTEQFTALQNNNPNAIVKIKHQDATYYETLEDFHTYINNETKYLDLPAVFRAKSYYQNVEDYNTGHSSELTPEEFNNLPKEQKIKDYYTYAEFSSTAGDVYTLFTTRLNDDIILPQSYKQQTPEVQKVLYTYDEYINLDKIEQDMFDALPADLKIKIPHADAVLYTEETANAYNLTLPGAKHVGDIKIPAHYALPSEGTLTSHNAGDLSVVGNKIVMYIFLKDGTRYSAELCTCLDTTGTAETNPNYGKPVTEWKRNEHYTYTITLTKEKIFFRALVKGWEEKKVGGNATLDWD